MYRFVFCLSIFFLCTWSSQAQEKPAKADAKLDAYFKAFLEEEFRQRPLEATRMGDHRFDHLLEDVSPEARAKWLARYKKTLQELPKKVDYKKLSRIGQIDFEIFRHELKRRIWLAENTDPFATDPRIYNDYISESIYMLFAQSTLSKAKNVNNAAKRMAFIPRVIEAAKRGIKNPSKVTVETAIKQTRGAISFYEVGIYQLAGETPGLSILKKSTGPVVKSLRGYLKFLQEESLPKAKGNWRLGKKKFAEKLELELNAGISSEEVLKEAESEFDRVVLEMYAIARQLWSKYYPKQPLPPDDKNGRRRTIQLVFEIINQDHGKPENLVKDARAGVENIKKFISEKKILTLPDPDQCKIIEMPEFKRGNSIAYLQSAPPLDPKSNSYYAISPPPSSWSPKKRKSFMEEYNVHILQILSIHEAYPGHYVQLEYSNRHPSFIRKVLVDGVFAEGWAVYTEHVMLDQGFGEGNLEFRLCQLKWYLRAVANAILDYKMHCTDISDEEAIRFLVEEAFQSLGEAILKVIRAKQSSCQLSTYFVGRTSFVRLRAMIQNRLGDDFDLGQFHEETLSHGTLPVRYLPELVGRALLKQTE